MLIIETKEHFALIFKTNEAQYNLPSVSVSFTLCLSNGTYLLLDKRAMNHNTPGNFQESN